MVETFKKLKKKAQLKAWLSAILLLISVAALAIGGALIVLNLLTKEMPLYGYLCGGGAGVLVAALTLLFTYPTTKRFARRIDEEYALHERTQTMVEYAAKSGEVVDMQRSDAEQALLSLPKKRKGFGFVCRVILLPILAVATLATGVILPKNEPTVTPPPVVVPEEDKPFESGMYQVKDMEQLIANVRSSTLAEPLKTEYLLQLEVLLEMMQDGETTNREMLAAVDGAMNIILERTTEVNTYNAYSAIIGADANATAIKPMGTVFMDAGRSYKKIEGVNLYLYSTLIGKEEPLKEYVVTVLTTYIDEVIAAIPADEAGFEGYVSEYSAAIESVLASKQVTEFAEDEEIKARLNALKTTLDGTLLGLKNDDYTLDGAKKEVVGGLELFVKDGGYTSGAAIAISTQAHSYMMKDYVLTALGEIFGVNPPQDGEEEEDKDPSGEGGGGSGNMEYPNQGEILNPDNGEYVPYYELLNEYYLRILEALEADEASDDPQIPEAVRAQIKAYFEALQTKNNE